MINASALIESWYEDWYAFVVVVKLGEKINTSEKSLTTILNNIEDRLSNLEK